MNDQAVIIENLNKTYPGGKKALCDVNLSIKKGDFFALLGANGAGKTTLINIITSLTNKNSGIVKVFGYDLDNEINQVKKQIGLVPQEFNFNIFEYIIDIVVNQAGYYGISKKESKEKAIEILTRLGLKDKLTNQAMTLSGGMKRRLMIARGLIHSPKLLILDEPTAGVDVELRHEMWEYLRELNQQGTTILLTTHYLEEVEELCNSASIIKDGKIIKTDSVKNLINSLQELVYTFEVEEYKEEKLKISNFKINFVDKNTFEVFINKNNSLDNFIFELQQKGIKILDIKTKNNRLEELFLNVLNNKNV